MTIIFGSKEKTFDFVGLSANLHNHITFQYNIKQ